MDSGVPGLNGNRAAKLVMMPSENENGSVIIQLPLLAVNLVQVVQWKRVYASLNGAILVSKF